MARPRSGDANGRVRLLDAAWEALVRDSGSAERISVASVCLAAGCTAPTLYHHFADLSDLLRAAGRRAFDSWADDIQFRVGDQPDPRVRLRRRAEAYLVWARTHPQAYRAMFAAPSAGRAAKELAVNDAAGLEPGPAFAPLVADVAALLRVESDDSDVLPTAIAHWAAVHGLASLAISTPQVPEAIWSAALVHLVAALTVAR